MKHVNIRGKTKKKGFKQKTYERFYTMMFKNEEGHGTPSKKRSNTSIEKQEGKILQF